MAIPAFPNVDVGKSTTFTRREDVDVIQFGDGYQQRAERGINPLTEEWRVEFDTIPETDYITIRDFLDDKIVNPFSWTPPTESTPRAFRLKEGSFRPDFSVGFQKVTLRCVFEEVHDLVTV